MPADLQYEWHPSRKRTNPVINGKSMRQPDGTIPADRSFSVASRDLIVPLDAHGMPFADVQTYEGYADNAGTQISVVCADTQTVTGFPVNFVATQIKGTLLYDATLELRVPWPGG